MTQECKYFVYSHVRQDKNEIFYIGMGTIQNKGNKYARAFSKYGRNKHWKRITNKTSYIVNILFEFIDIDSCKNKEIELIKLYGKVVNGGLLCNLTDGGDGMSGLLHSEKTKKLIGEKSKGRIHSLESRKKISKVAKLTSKYYCSKEVIDLRTGIFYNSLRKAYQSRILNMSYRTFANRLNPNQSIKNNTDFIYV